MASISNRPLGERMEEARQRASFSIQDMVTWFACSRQSMVGWLKGAEPRDYMRPAVEQALSNLDGAIAARIGLPVPLSTPQQDRKTYIEKIRAAYNVRNAAGIP